MTAEETYKPEETREGRRQHFRDGMRPNPAPQFAESLGETIMGTFDVKTSTPNSVYGGMLIVSQPITQQASRVCLLPVVNVVLNQKETPRDKFNRLASQWYRETGMLSFIDRRAAHKSYQQIIGMGKDALPFIFREMENNKGDWFWALNAILPEEHPAAGETNFKKAVKLWLNWAKEERIYPG